MSPFRTARRAPLVAAAILAGLMATSCTATAWDTSGADHPTTTTEPHYPSTRAGLVASITDHLSGVGPDLNEWAPSRHDAHCAAVQIVARLGLNRMLDLGFQPQDGSLALPYTDDERTSLTNILVGCIDFRAGLLSLISSYEKLDVTPAQCLTDGIDRQGLTQQFAAAFLAGGEPDPFANNNQLGIGMGALLAQCLTPASDLVPGSPELRFPTGLDGPTTTRPPSDASESTTPGSGGATTSTAPG